MSIAVAAVVKPSRILRVLVMGMHFLPALVLLSLARFDELLLFWRWLFWTLGIAIVLTAIRHARRAGGMLHIDISGSGQIRVSEAGALSSVATTFAAGEMQKVRLKPSSTIWPFLLLLRLERQDGKIVNKVILPDSMSADSFRTLSVALRWLAIHEARVERKIL
ncbi:MAG: hypothetical protein JSS58_07775 [Proteobacteria bacterium]|nr:hypothetical protein [Pseudomonadota bacterium]